jgi:hypothetical protein
MPAPLPPYNPPPPQLYRIIASERRIPAVTVRIVRFCFMVHPPDPFSDEPAVDKMITL